MSVASLLVIAGVLAAPYQAYVLQTGANVWDAAARDITGDGQAEVFALCCDETSQPLTKFVEVFVPDAAGAYPVHATFRLDLEPSISMLFLAEADGAAPVELVAGDAAGATVYHYADGRFAPVAQPRFPSLWPSGAKEPSFLKDAATDLDGDGIDEWIVPVPCAHEIRKPGALLARIPCDVVSEIQRGDSLYIYHRLPSWHEFKIEGEANKCLAFLSDEFADFAHGPEWSRHERFKVPLNLEEKWEASTKMDDINADGLPDLVVTQTKGSVNLKSITQVYLASGPFRYPETPTATFEANGAIASPAVVDVDGDGQKDLIVISVPLGVKNIINYFVRRKISARVDVYLFKDGALPAKPDFAENVLLDAPEGRERVAYTVGDFNGDGRADIAFGAGSEKLVLHTSTATEFISSRPWLTLNVPTFGVARAYDLNGNPNKDLVLFHPGGAYKKRVDVIVF